MRRPLSKAKIKKIDTLINNTKQHHSKAVKKSFPLGYYDMITMRILGASYSSIAHATGYSYSWVKHLFAFRGNVWGMIHGFYEPFDKWSIEYRLSGLSPTMKDWLIKQLSKTRNSSKNLDLK